MSRFLISTRDFISHQLVWRRELVLVLLLGVLALTVRVPNFMTVPPLTDEFKEVGWAINAFAKNEIPLVAYDAYDGPLFTYLLMLMFRIFGLTVFLPRLLVLVIGALTVVVTYYFGKVLARGDWRVGAAAALLLAVNSTHILFNSHVAWSNATTPFFTTLTMLAYIYATRANHPPWLVGAGVLYGLGLQTHPSTLALAGAFTADFMLRRESRAMLKTVFPYLAFGGVLLGYAPMLYFNWQSGFETLRIADTTQYALGAGPTLAGMFPNLAPQVSTVGRVALGSILDDSSSWFTDFVLVLFAGFTLMAFIWMARRGEIFPLVAGSVVLLFFAYFNRFTSVPDSARYYQFMLPLLYAAWGQGGIYVWERLATRGAAWRRAAGIGLGVLLLLLCATSLLALQTYYTNAYASGSNSAALLRVIETTRQEPESPFLLEWELARIRTGRGGNVAQNVKYMQDLVQRETILVSTSTPEALGGLQNFLREHESAYLMMFSTAPDELGTEFPLQVLMISSFPCPSCGVSTEFALYRWQEP